MNRRAPLRLPAIAVAAIIAAACSSQPVPVPMPTTALSPAPAAADATSSPAPVLRVDGMASVVTTTGLAVSEIPDLRTVDRSTPVLPRGAVVFLVDGPRTIKGVDWWLVQQDDRAAPPQFGWVALTGPARLAPLATACPSGAAVDVHTLRNLGMLAALSCFGGSEITLRGLVTCRAESIDYVVGGPSWLDSYRSCVLDDALALNGPEALAGVDPIEGGDIARYEVRGHFDDPQAKTCSPISFGVTVTTPVGPPEVEAVLTCRQMFVVTVATRLG